MQIEISDKLINKAIKETIEDLYSNSPELISKTEKKEFKLQVKKKIENYIKANLEDISAVIIEQINDD
jgi:dihydroxyacetone kinase-like predicted kinase